MVGDGAQFSVAEQTLDITAILETRGYTPDERNELCHDMVVYLSDCDYAQVLQAGTSVDRLYAHSSTVIGRQLYKPSDVDPFGEAVVRVLEQLGEVETLKLARIIRASRKIVGSHLNLNQLPFAD